MIVRYKCTSMGRDPKNLFDLAAGGDAEGFSPAHKFNNAIFVGVNKYKPVQVGNPVPVIAIPLISCASVVFAKGNKDSLNAGYVYHANGGCVMNSDIVEIKSSLSCVDGDLIVAYAHQGGLEDKGYQDNIRILEQEFPEAIIVEIYNLPQNFFGMDGMSQVG